MLLTTLKIAIASATIVFASWLSGKKPELAGFITALPLVSILAIAFSYIQHQDAATTAQYARSIVLAVPVSWLFFLPFFFIGKWDVHFWVSFAVGGLLLVLGYFLHQYVMQLFMGE